MTRINYKSDFVLRVALRDVTGTRMDASLPWSATLSIGMPVAGAPSFVPEVRREGDELLIVADGHNLPAGKLWLTVCADVPDERMPDGCYHICHPVYTGIVLDLAGADVNLTQAMPVTLCLPIATIPATEAPLPSEPGKTPSAPTPPSHVICHPIPEHPVPGAIYKSTVVRFNVTKKHPDWIGEGVVTLPVGELRHLLGQHGYVSCYCGASEEVAAYGITPQTRVITVPYPRQYDEWDRPLIVEIRPDFASYICYTRILKNAIIPLEASKVTLPMLTLPAPTLDEIASRASFRVEEYLAAGKTTEGPGYGFRARKAKEPNPAEYTLEVQYGQRCKLQKYLADNMDDEVAQDPEGKYNCTAWRWKRLFEGRRIHRKIAGKTGRSATMAIRFRARYKTAHRASPWTYFVLHIWACDDRTKYVPRLYPSDPTGRFSIDNKMQPWALWT